MSEQTTKRLWFAHGELPEDVEVTFHRESPDGPLQPFIYRDGTWWVVKPDRLHETREAALHQMCGWAAERITACTGEIAAAQDRLASAKIGWQRLKDSLEAERATVAREANS